MFSVSRLHSYLQGQLVNFWLGRVVCQLGSKCMACKFLDHILWIQKAEEQPHGPGRAHPQLHFEPNRGGFWNDRSRGGSCRFRLSCSVRGRWACNSFFPLDLNRFHRLARFLTVALFAKGILSLTELRKNFSSLSFQLSQKLFDEWNSNESEVVI